MLKTVFPREVEAGASWKGWSVPEWFPVSRCVQCSEGFCILKFWHTIIRIPTRLTVHVELCLGSILTTMGIRKILEVDAEHKWTSAVWKGNCKPKLPKDPINCDVFRFIEIPRRDISFPIIHRSSQYFQNLFDLCSTCFRFLFGGFYFSMFFQIPGWKINFPHEFLGRIPFNYMIVLFHLASCTCTRLIFQGSLYSGWWCTIDTYRHKLLDLIPVLVDSLRTGTDSVQVYREGVPDSWRTTLSLTRLTLWLHSISPCHPDMIVD